MPYRNEQPVNINLLRNAVHVERQPVKLTVAVQLLDHGIGDYAHGIKLLGAIDKRLFRTEPVAPMNNINKPRNARKIQSVGKRGIAPADDRNGLVLKERAVAQRAITHAVADKVFLSRHSQTPMLATRGDNNSLGGILARVRDDGSARALGHNLQHGFALKARARLFGLVEQIGRELRARNIDNPGIVFDVRRVHNLTPERIALYDKRGLIRPASINGGAQARRSAAYDNEIKHWFCSLYTVYIICRSRTF